MKEYLFVYGTLKQGYCNDSLLENAEFIGAATTPRKYKMLDLGWFPGVVDGNHYIKGEVYKVDNLKSIDTLEGYPHLYGREKTKVWVIKTSLTKLYAETQVIYQAWIYKLMKYRTNYGVITSGEWTKR